MVELAPLAKQFLRAAFSAADVDRDELLSPAEQEELFSTAPSKYVPRHADSASMLPAF